MTAKLKIKNLQNLYESDYLQWLEETIRQLKLQRVASLDYDHLIEELEELSQSEKRRMRSFLEQIIRHLLMYEYWQSEREYNQNHWEAELIGFRNQINEDLTTNLRNHLEENFSSIYGHALDYVRAKTKLTNLPEVCPYSLEQTLNKTWLP
jgi:metal-responsive CopG/Arc/MetJ family transcriptional regulator